MARALAKIAAIPDKPSPVENQYAYLMFRSGSLGQLFSTHPTYEQRRRAIAKGDYIRRLPRRPAGE